MSQRARRVALVLGCSAALAGGAGAATASAAATIALGAQADLIGRVAVQVPVTVTCGPFAPGTFFVFGFVSVSQASGREIASGGTQFTGVQCDGAPQTVTLAVSANTSGPPFHNGKAVATASVSVAGESATVGPQEIRLR